MITLIKYIAARKKNGELETISREVIGTMPDDGTDQYKDLARILAPGLKKKIEMFACERSGSLAENKR